MPRPTRRARGRRIPITEAERLWAHAELTSDHSDAVEVGFFTSNERLLEVWQELGREVVEAWIKDNPGTRPDQWWASDSPSAPRRRLGGTGTPRPEEPADDPDLDFGIPGVDAWVSDEEAEIYNRPSSGIDPEDPPTYESQASYLDRHGLLTDAERAVLDAQGWPEPETVQARA